MFCTNCGGSIAPDWGHCPKCGAKVVRGNDSRVSVSLADSVVGQFHQTVDSHDVTNVDKSTHIGQQFLGPTQLNIGTAGPTEAEVREMIGEARKLATQGQASVAFRMLDELVVDALAEPDLQFLRCIAAIDGRRLQGLSRDEAMVLEQKCSQIEALSPDHPGPLLLRLGLRRLFYPAHGLSAPDPPERELRQKLQGVSGVRDNLRVLQANIPDMEALGPVG